MPIRKISHFLALRRNTSILLVTFVLAGTGEKMWLGFAPKYLEILGASIFIIGSFDALQTIIGAAYAYPGGWITDHFGERKSLLLFSAISIFGYFLVLVWKHWLALIAGTFIFTAWSAFSLPATFTVVATSLKSSQYSMGIGVQSMVRRVGMVFGPLIGGWLISKLGWNLGIQYALVICIFLSLTTMVTLTFMINPDMGKVKPEGSILGFREVVASFSPTLKELLISDILIRFCERIPSAFVILWALNHLGVTAKTFGLLVALEMVIAMLCYIPVSHLADRHGKGPFVLITFIFFTAFPLCLLWSHNETTLLIAFAIRGLKEFGEPSRKALIMSQARPHIRSRTYGAYYFIRDSTVTIGSLLGAWLWTLGPAWNFLGAATFGVAGTLWFAMAGLKRSR